LSDPALHFADVTLATGVRLHYAAQGDPRGEVVLLLHGYGDSWFSYSRVLPLLSERYRVYALDLRGHGDSDRPTAGYAMRDLAADVLAFMDAQGIVRASVVGHSMGSFVAQQVALAAPDRVTSLVLVGSGTTPRHIQGVADLERAVNTLGDPSSWATFAREFQESTIYGPLPPAFVDRAVAESLKLPASVWRGVMAGMLATDPATQLRAGGVHTLILWGDHDSVFTRAEQNALLAMLPHAQFVAYPETGHAVHWERPAEFARDLAGFVGRAER
jgi:pimeloyl-ACP methyl ester carboxylesterase